MNLRDLFSTRAVVYSALIAALYIVLNIFVAPIAYGPLQFRAGNLLYPLALFNPLFALGFGLGAFITNLGSPFGIWDIVPMPVITVLAAFLAWKLRKTPVLGLLTQALLIAIGVSVFPLWLGGRIPVLATLPGVLVSSVIVVLLGWFLLWRPFSKNEKLAEILNPR